MKTHKTMCRWCGGEMELLNDEEYLQTESFIWQCNQCKCVSDYYSSEPAALEWASQPIPFLPEAKETFYIDEGTKDDYYDAGIENGEAHLIGKITAALAVREEEQR